MRICKLAGLAALLSCASVAQAQPAAADGKTEATSETRATPFAASKAADEAVLDKATAREDLSLVAQSQQSATASNNSVSGTSTTGDIRIGDNAFQNANGMTIINANSGNNVAMNASINVNIVMTPPQQ